MPSSRQKSGKGMHSQDEHSEETVWAGIYVDAEMRSVLLQALHRLADYRNGPTPRVPMLNQDYTFHLLDELIYYSPNRESFMRIVKQIIGCTDRAAIQSLAEEYIEKLIIPMHTLITTDWGNTTPMPVDRTTFVVTPQTLHEASKDITLLKSMVMVRDGFMCPVTGKCCTGTSGDPLSEASDLEVIPILPISRLSSNAASFHHTGLSLVKQRSTEIAKFMSEYSGIPIDDLACLSRPANFLTLDSLHAFLFKNMDVCFVPQPGPHKYRLISTCSTIQEPSPVPSGTDVYLATSASVARSLSPQLISNSSTAPLELPDHRFLALHATVSRVLYSMPALRFELRRHAKNRIQRSRFLYILEPALIKYALATAPYPAKPRLIEFDEEDEEEASMLASGLSEGWL
ncbi:hypothetical protein FRC04_008118 [Tulasnella sp. 424]|nr:hypothetical protein FRC04_008118 [Tulasnella sp. 424]KAG8974775.1 hypothetical protein FRC05_006936 [Tulasnella sp. 425]